MSQGSFRSRKPVFKIITLGDQGVGKTSIVECYIRNNFNPKTEPTLGACFYKRDLENCSLEIWDTAGDERYHSLLKLYYKNADAVIMVYSIESRRTFERIEQWARDIANTCDTKPCIILVANKSDMLEKEEVSYSEFREYAVRHPEWGFVYASAKQNKNIGKIFSTAADMLFSKVYQKERSVRQKELSLQNRKRKRKTEKTGCC